MLHHRRRAVAVDGANLHTNGAALIARHHRAAALVDELVLFHAAPPDLFAHQGAAGAALDADLAYLAKGVKAVVHRRIESDRGVGGDDLQAAAGAGVRGQQLAVGAQLPQAGGHEHRDGGGAVVAGAVHLGVVAQRADVVGQPQAQGRLNFVGAVMPVFGVHTGSRLRFGVVLLQGQADGVGVFHMGFAVLIDITGVVEGKAHFQIAHFAGFVANEVGDILAAGRAGGRQVAGAVHQGVELFHHRLVLVVVGLHGRGADAGRPFGVGGVFHLLPLQRILAAVEIDILADHRNAGLGLQLFGNGNLHRVITVAAARPDDGMADFQHNPLSQRIGCVGKPPPRIVNISARLVKPRRPTSWATST